MKSTSFAAAAALLQLGAVNAWVMNTTFTTSTGTAPVTYLPPGKTTVTQTKTEVVSKLTTYCPHPTTITQNSKTYTVTSATTLTIEDCPCTLTKTYNPEQKTYVAYTGPAPTYSVLGNPATTAGFAPHPAPPGLSDSSPPAGCPAVQTVTVTVGAPGIPPAGAPPGAPSTAAVDTPAPSTLLPPATNSPPPPPATNSPPPPPSATETACPLILPGVAGVDHLVPAQIAQAAAGRFSSLETGGTVKRGNATWFNFDVPASYAGRMCEIRFALPASRSADFTLTNPDNAQIDFIRRSFPVIAGAPVNINGSTVLTPWAPPKINGNFLFATRECPAGRTAIYSASTNSSTLDFNFQQENSPCALGMFIIPK